MVSWSSAMRRAHSAYRHVDQQSRSRRKTILRSTALVLVRGEAYMSCMRSAAPPCMLPARAVSKQGQWAGYDQRRKSKPLVSSVEQTRRTPQAKRSLSEVDHDDATAAESLIARSPIDDRSLPQDRQQPSNDANRSCTMIRGHSAHGQDRTIFRPVSAHGFCPAGYHNQLLLRCAQVKWHGGRG